MMTPYLLLCWLIFESSWLRDLQLQAVLALKQLPQRWPGTCWTPEYGMQLLQQQSLKGMWVTIWFSNFSENLSHAVWLGGFLLIWSLLSTQILVNPSLSLFFLAHCWLLFSNYLLPQLVQIVITAIWQWFVNIRYLPPNDGDLHL